MSANGAEGLNKNQELVNGEDSSDGPQPMRDKKPCKTTPNSADQFWEAHQGEYEARGKRSSDQVDRVRNHNAAYPSLKDELEKRRSTTRVKAVISRKRRNDDFVCHRCRKMRRIIVVKDSKLLERSRSRQNNIKYRKKNRISSRNNRRPAKHGNDRQSMSRYRKKSRGRDDALIIHNSQTSVEKTNTKKAVDNLKPQMIKENGRSTVDKYAKNARGIRAEKSKMSVKKNESGSSVGSLKNPGTNSTVEPSVSSYHSFSSMEQEPMLP